MASTNLSMLNKTSNNSLSDECYTPNEGILPLLSEPITFLIRLKIT